MLNMPLPSVAFTFNRDIMKADTGASRTYLKSEHEKYLLNTKILTHGPTATLPNNEQIKASTQGILPLHSAVRPTALIYPALQNESLLSIGQLCDHGCIAIFDKNKLHIVKDGKLVLSGLRNLNDGLWDVPFKNNDIQSINYIISKEKSKTELAQYLHACAFSPVVSTFQQCIKKGNFITWPGIDDINFKKFINTTEATIKGHLDQERQNVQSTKSKQSIETEDVFPSQIKEKTSNCFYIIFNLEKDATSYTDLTGRFPHQSSRGNNYIFLAYNYDSNAILVEAIPNRETATIIAAWKKTHDRLQRNGVATKHYVLDNECSAVFKEALHKENVSFELVPPHQHRRNSAERAIRSFKNHFLAGLGTCDPNFPLREWDRLLSQAELTLNLLRNSRLNPKLSAWAFLFGNHDFNKNPLLPPGTRVILHAKPGKRASWAFHGEQGWYVGPATEHYRCITCYIPKTHRERITDTAKIIPNNIPLPQASLNEHLRATATDLVHLLNHKEKAFPVHQSTTNALLDIAKILGRDSTPPISDIVPVNKNNKTPIIPNDNNKTSVSPFVNERTITSNERGGRTSEGERISTSEGEGVVFDVYKKTITPVITTTIPKYSGLYGQKSSIKKIHIAPKHTPIKKSTHSNFSESLQKIIEEYVNVPKATRSSLRSKLIPNMKPRIAPSYIPIPKSYKSMRQSTSHPMLLRKRFSTIRRQPSYKHLAAQSILTNEVTNNMLHIFNEEGNKLSLDKLLRDNPAIWGTALSNEIGRLSQGVSDVKGNNAMTFIPRHEVPKNKKVAYANMVCDHKPLKDEKYRVRLTIGGDVLDYAGDKSSPAASLIEAKLLLNSVISDCDKGARFMSLDIKDFFLQSNLPESEYLRIHGKYFLKDIRLKYGINAIIAEDGFVYCKVNRGIYGLKQAAKLARDQLIENLKPYGYSPSPFAPNIWKHSTRPTKFCLCVDDFGVKYFSEDDANHLISSLKTAYNITTDIRGDNFCGLHLEWDYSNKWVDISMPEYVKKTLKKLDHPTPQKPTHAPHRWVPKTYGKKIHLTQPEDISEKLSTEETRKIQSIVGSFLYYARAVDSTIHTALNDIATTQASPTKKTKDATIMLLDYLHTHPNAKIRFHASDMQMHIDSDAAYLVAPKAKSRIVGYFYLSDTYPNQQSSLPTLNAPVHIECQLLKHVVTSAAEAETSAIFHNTKIGIWIKKMLTALGHPQNIIPIKTDNSTAEAFSNSTLKEKKSKAWDMRLNWLQDRVKQKDIKVYWSAGSNNFADYPTKHFSPTYHQKIRPTYILKGYHINNMGFSARVC